MSADGQTDGRTDRRMDGHGETSLPPSTLLKGWGEGKTSCIMGVKCVI